MQEKYQFVPTLILHWYVSWLLYKIDLLSLHNMQEKKRQIMDEYRMVEL